MIEEKFWVLYDFTDSEIFNKRKYTDKRLAESEAKIVAIATHKTIVVLESIVGYELDINRIKFERFEEIPF